MARRLFEAAEQSTKELSWSEEDELSSDLFSREEDELSSDLLSGDEDELSSDQSTTEEDERSSGGVGPLSTEENDEEEPQCLLLHQVKRKMKHVRQRLPFSKRKMESDLDEMLREFRKRQKKEAEQMWELLTELEVRAAAAREREEMQRRQQTQELHGILLGGLLLLQSWSQPQPQAELPLD